MNLPPPAQPPPPARWQFGIPDLIFFALVALLGQALTAVLLAARLLRLRASEREGAVVVTLLLTLAGGLAGFGRAQKQRHPEHQLKPYLALYAFGALTLGMGAWCAGLKLSLICVGMSLPSLLVAKGIIRWRGYDDLCREGIVLSCLMMGWALLLFAGMFGAIFNMTITTRSPRIRNNELCAAAACRTYVEAQEIYRRTDWDGDGVLEYAKAISGKHSLYEKDAGSGNLMLLDAAIASAEGAPGAAQPKAGYVFRILRSQGPQAPGGARSYLVNGHLTEGFALVATPAAYDCTGCRTLLVNQTGVVYWKDLGPATTAIVNAITEYNPDETWEVAP
ncbi:MAG: DUF2950 family protein [Planctomycetota bacterium]|nr:DUF2950 family protein [Planctomycetota bacterium]